MGALEPVPVSADMQGLIHRRTAWVMREIVNFDMPLKIALANAYIAGMSDAVQAAQPADSKDGARNLKRRK